MGPAAAAAIQQGIHLSLVCDENALFEAAIAVRDSSYQAFARDKVPIEPSQHSDTTIPLSRDTAAEVRAITPQHPDLKSNRCKRLSAVVSTVGGVMLSAPVSRDGIVSSNTNLKYYAELRLLCKCCCLLTRFCRFHCMQFYFILFCRTLLL